MGGGASAAADFAANKPIAIADLRGRVRAGDNNMGGADAGRLTSTTMTPDGNTLGATGGAQTETATVSGSASVTVAGTISGGAVGSVISDSPSNDIRGMQPGGDFAAGPGHVHNVNINVPVAGTCNASGGGSISGNTAAATNVQPTMIFSAIIKL